MTSTPEAVQAVLALFKGPLSDVRFADVDASGLESVAVEVERAAAAVQEQEANLAALRLSLGERQEALLSLAHRALAYARVYAESDEALSARLNAISLPRAAKPRKSARPPQAQAEVAADTSAEAAVQNAAEIVSGESESESETEAEAVTPAAPVQRGRGKRRSNPESTETSA
jgi:hypothetical protein